MKNQLLQVVILISIVFAETTMGKELTVAVTFASNETSMKHSQEMIISKIEEELIKYKRYQVISFQSSSLNDVPLKLPEKERMNRLDRLIIVSIDILENSKVFTLKMVEPGSFVICASVQEVIRGDGNEFIKIIETMVDTLIRRETEYCKNENEQKEAKAPFQNNSQGEEVNITDQQQKNEGRPSQEQTASSTSSNEQLNRQMNVWNRYVVGAVLIILMMMMVTLSSQPKN